MIYLILLLALILRILIIDQSFWLDEAAHALMSQKNLGVILNNISDFHPPLSYILSHFWIKINQSETWLRLLPVLFGVATIYFVYKIGTEFFSKKVGLLAALLLSVAPYNIYYSQEFRMYSMAAFFATASMYYYLLLTNKQSKHHVFLYIITSALLLYTHYMGVFLIVSQLIAQLITNRTQLKSLLKNQLAVLILFLPWLPILLSQLRGGIAADQYLPGWSQMLSVELYKAVPLMITKFIIGRIDFENMILYSLIMLFILSFVGLLLIKSFINNLKQKEHKQYLMIFFWVVLPVIMTFLISFKLPMFQPFRLLFILPGLMLLLSIGIIEFKKLSRVFAVALIGILTISQIYFLLNPIYWREDWKGAMKFLSNKQNSTIITAWPEPFAPMTWYGKDLEMRGILSKMPGAESDVIQKIDQIKVDKVYYISYLSQLSDPNGYIKQKFEEKYKLVNTTDFRGVGFIYHYQR